MNKLILCEGVTDAILLSYYLEKVSGWKFCKGPKNLAIKPDSHNQSVNWYRKEENYLLICGVGGKDNFGNFFRTKIKDPVVITNAFEKMAIVTDRDDRDIEKIRTDMLNEMEGFVADFQDRVWCSTVYQDGYGREQKIENMLLVSPREYHGALESVMLEAIAENPYDKNIVEKTDAFVQQMRIEAGQYIATDRLQLKAKLGVTWAIQFPEKVFSLIDEQIRSVVWEKYEVLRKCFEELVDI